jgi:hypothetical protein
MAFKIKQHLLAVYIITFYFLNAIRNFAKFIFANTTFKQNISKKEVGGLRQNRGHQTKFLLPLKVVGLAEQPGNIFHR